MKKGFNLGQSDFDALMDLLSLDREEAGRIYERIRLGLLRFFYHRGLPDAEDLVDETFNRVASKTARFDRSLNLKPESFFFGFANLIAKEHHRTIARQSPLNETETGEMPAVEDLDEAPEVVHMLKCLQSFAPDDRQLFISYYSAEGQERMDLRKNLCEQLDATAASLYTRISRIKTRLRECIERARRAAL